MKKPKMNLMTSCNDGIAQYILPQLASLSVTNSRYDIAFYLFHTDISDTKIKLIADYADSVHISFFEVKITDTEIYEYAAKSGGRWPREAYYTINLQKYLPQDLDRIMYVDAGDAFWNGDCGRFYFADFIGHDKTEKSIIATMYRSMHTMVDGLPTPVSYDVKELFEKKDRDAILRGTFSSGTVLYNLKRIRTGFYEPEDYRILIDRIKKLERRETNLYFGDQGLLSAAYLGDVKYWGFPNCVFYIARLGAVFNFTAYNHVMSTIKSQKIASPGYTWIEPVIVHFDDPDLKPWKPKYNEAQIREILFPDPEKWHIPVSVEDWQSVYWDYVRMTPIYEEMLADVLEHCKGNNPTQ